MATASDAGAPAVEFRGGELAVRFDRFGLDAYELFLRCKKLPEYRVEFHEADETYTVTAPARFAPVLGAPVPAPPPGDLPLSDFLFDDQAAIVRMALDAKRFAVWSNCGLGKSLIELEFARHALHRTGGRALLVTLNEVVPQMLAEAARFYPGMPVLRLGSQADLVAWCREGEPGLAVTNYEKFNPARLGPDPVINECRLLSCVVLDESSRLKGGGDSKQKKVINASCKGVEYKLSGTATPAPNDTIEFVSQATFLEKVRTELDIIWSYFVRDSKTHRRTVKPHARAAFFDFMAGWSVYLKHPARFGWRLGHPEVPAPEYFTHEIPSTPEQRAAAAGVLADEGGTGLLFVSRDTNAVERLKLAQIARGFVYRKAGKGKGAGARRAERIPALKPGFIADLVASEAAAGHQVLVWAVFDEETVILKELLDGLGVAPDVLTGATREAERLAVLNRFRAGETRCLVSRPRMLGYGMNFQCCTSMVFSGFSESFEDLYQAVARAVRYGQSRSVRVHFPVVEDLEGDTFANLKRKAARNDRATSEMEDNYLRSYLALRGRAC
jgi:hypothetical protein